MVIGLSCTLVENPIKGYKTSIMKKTIKKIINNSLQKIKEHKQRITTYKFSTYREDFVITAQEEREGGFFGFIDPALNLQLAK